MRRIGQTFNLIFLFVIISISAKASALSSITDTCAATQPNTGRTCGGGTAKSQDQAGPWRISDYRQSAAGDASERISYLFRDAPMEELLWKTHLWLDQAYEVNGELCEPFSVQTPSDVKIDEVEAAFLSALRSHSLNIVPQEDHYLIQNALQGNSLNSNPSADSTEQDARNKPNCVPITKSAVETRLVRFSLIPKALAYEWLKAYLSPQGDVRLADHSNSLAFSDLPSRLGVILLIVKLIDPLAVLD